LLAACAPPEEPSPAETAGTEILWDEWGVPHVFATDPESLFYAQGWAQATNHLELMLRLYGAARGRAAEYWGEEHLESDRWVHTVGIPARAVEWYRRQGSFQPWIAAFARAVNDYASSHPEAVPPEVRRVLPVTGADVLAHLQRVVHFTFVVDRGEVARAARVLGRGRAAAALAPPAAREPAAAKGSNAWAVAPSRSASGHAMLVANPHLPWSERFTWTEMQLTSPEVDVYGATLVGTPFISIGFNDHLAWTHTVNTHDGADLYRLTLDGDGYRFDGERRPFEVDDVELAIRGEDGSVRRETLRVRRSVHGPVVAERDGEALALRVVGLDQPALFQQYWDMARAGDLTAFEAALRTLQMPMFTVMYADRDGHVMHLFGGRTPRRPAGDWQWSGVVPGDTSATLWTETHPYDELPKVVDPPSGWLQNANDPPWTTTVPPALDPAAFPPYMAPRGMSFRAQQSARLLRDDEKITFEELVAYKHDTRMLLAERLLDDLAAAVAAHGDERARRALAVLEAWDGKADAASRGGVLFARFVRLLGAGPATFAKPWRDEEPLSTPDGLADPPAAAAALSRAAAEVEEAYGSLEVPWGEVYRLMLGDRDLPANGGPGSLGIFRVVGYAPAGEGRFRAAGGDSFVAVVELGDPVRAQTLISYGNASQRGSPHAGDQLPLFARKELRPVWRSRAEIEPHVVRRESF